MTHDDMMAVINRHCKAAMDTPFAYGASDCCTFACDIVREVTGVDVMEHMRPQYGSRITVVKLQHNISHNGLPGVAMRLAMEYGDTLKPSVFPWSGHLVGIVASPVGPVMGLFDGTAWIVRSERGIARMAAHLGVLGWSFAP